MGDTSGDGTSIREGHMASTSMVVVEKGRSHATSLPIASPHVGLTPLRSGYAPPLGGRVHRHFMAFPNKLFKLFKFFSRGAPIICKPDFLPQSPHIIDSSCQSPFLLLSHAYLAECYALVRRHIVDSPLSIMTPSS